MLMYFDTVNDHSSRYGSFIGGLRCMIVHDHASFRFFYASLAFLAMLFASLNTTIYLISISIERQRCYAATGQKR